MRHSCARRSSTCRSGVESRPGVKDPDRIEAFLREAARLAAADGPRTHDACSSTAYRTGPDERGRFGNYGGRYVAETLMPLVLELEQAYAAAKRDPAFQAELRRLAHALRRPAVSPLYFAERLTEHLGGAKIYFKREELNHTGAHKINNCIGQILLARRMGKTRIIAETGAGQHGVATATVCARFGLPCVVYMGERRHRAAEAQRLPHAPAGRRGPAGDARARARSRTR